MERLLNEDGTPSFTSISDLRNNFEESFAKKQLGATMKEIVIKSVNSIQNRNAENITSDNNIRHLINNSISDISDKCFTNDELNGSSYLGGLRKLVKEYANMEADYREELANAINSTEKDKAVAGGKIIELFSTENLNFMNKDIKARFLDELNIGFSTESEDIITEIGKEVGSVIAEAEEKNVIINETSKVIQEKQEEIRKELSSTDEDDEEEETSSNNNEEFDDSEDDGVEPSTEDESNGNTEASGLEDYDNEVSEIEEKLEESLDNDIENGNITIGEQDISIVSEHTEDGADGNEEPEQVPTDLTVSEPDNSNVPLEMTDYELKGAEEYNRLKFSNENIGKVVVPLSPTRLDSINIPSAKALGTIYAKGSESLNSLKNVIEGRFNILNDIVEREHDEELTKKYNDYKARALEAFDDAMDIQGTFSSIGITPRGLEDVNDPVNVTIGAKAYKYLSGTLNIKNKTPKASYKGLEDAIDAAFDIAIMKDAARYAKDNDALIAINRDRMSREDLFWNNIINVEADDNAIEQVKNILQFGDLDIDKKALVDTQFLTNIELGIDTIGVKKPGKSESEINKEIFDRTKERIESFLGKDLTYQQIEIIEAMIEGRDTSDYAPTPFEKFVIKLGTDKVLEKNGGKDFEVGQESADEIKNKAIILCTLNSIVDKLSPMNSHDTNEFKEYIGA